MVSVDDLTISLRIDDVSNLGKLQKQLTALVGERGEKLAELQLDTIIKRDIQDIKDRMIKFTPTVLMSENLKEAAFALASDLKGDKNLRSNILQRYNINVDKYESFIEELLNISIGISKQNDDQQKGFIAEMDKFRKIAMMTKGQRKVLITRLTKMMLEAGFHEKVVDLLREVGLKVLSKPQMYELTKGSIGEQFETTIKEFKGEYPIKFDKLQKIFEENSDALISISKAYKMQTGKIFDITEVTQGVIKENKDLQVIMVAQVAAALEKSNWMIEEFYKAGQSLFTKKGKAFAVAGPAELDVVVHKFSSDAIKELGMEKVVGDSIDDNMENILVEFKTVAGKGEVNYEARKRLIEQGYDTLFFIVDEYTKEAVDRITELLSKKEFKGKKIGLYQMHPRTAEKLLKIEKSLDDLTKIAIRVIEKIGGIEKGTTEGTVGKLEFIEKGITEEKEKELNKAKEQEGTVGKLEFIEKGITEEKEKELNKAKEQEEENMKQVFASLSDLTPTEDVGRSTISEDERIELAEKRYKKLAEKIDESTKIVKNTNEKINEKKLTELPREESDISK